MSYSATSVSGQDAILTASAVTAAVAAVGLAAAQSDFVSRMIQSPEKLQNKRLREYSYRWEQSIDKTFLRCQYHLAGGIEAAHSSADRTRQANIAPPTKIWDEDGLKELIREWMKEDKKNAKIGRKGVSSSNIDAGSGDQSTASSSTTNTSFSSPFPRILGFSREKESREVLVELCNPLSGAYELPLARFGLHLADIVEDVLTSTALCFVADASSGLGSQMIADMLDASKAGVAIIREPTWMAAFASLVGERAISKDKMQRILFGLCRMEALRVREQVGDARTVMFTIPGQAVTPVLLPMLQAAFPEDRHVFVYNGCAASVERALFLRKQYRRATLPTSLEDALSYYGDPAASDPTRITTPLRSRLTKSVLGLSSALASLSVTRADIVEAWMGSVDTFFQLKEEENANGYLPYTLKVGLLVGNPDGSLEPQSDRYYSLASLMQFVTGCRSRPLPEGVLDAAVEWLRDFADQHCKTIKEQPHLSEAERKALENCVFKHKLILIGDKTLKDTVLPKQHWTLKQAVKNGCACCAPEDDEDDVEEQQMLTNSTGITREDSRESGEDSTVLNGSGMSSGFVDGKLSFAFDPSKFSTPVPAPTPTPNRTSRSNYVDGKASFAFDPTKFS